MKNNVLTYICLNTFYIYIFKYPDCVGHLFICLGPILECDFKSSFISLRWIYSSLELSAMNNFKIRDGTLGLLSLLNSMFHLVWAWEGIVHVISHKVHTYNFPVIFWVYQINCVLEVIPLSVSFFHSVPSSIIHPLYARSVMWALGLGPSISKVFILCTFSYGCSLLFCGCLLILLLLLLLFWFGFS